MSILLYLFPLVKDKTNMNYVKGKMAEKLHVPELVDTVRVHGTNQLISCSKQYPYLHQTLPASRMSDRKRRKLLNKIRRIAQWLDSAVPSSPIPLGIDSILVSIISTN
jgi:hypothetical protein